MKWEKVDPQAPTPRADFIRVWLNELYYGDNKQGVDYLCRVHEGSKFFCCLGVGSRLFGYSFNKLIFAKEVGPDFKVAVVAKGTGSLPAAIANFLQMDTTSSIAFYKPGQVRAVVLAEIKEFISQYKTCNFTPISLATINDNRITFNIIALVIRKFAEHIFDKLTEAELKYIRETKLEGKHSKADDL